jgi:signal transduction histidine kinase
VVIAVADDDTAEIRIVHRWGFTGTGPASALQARLLPQWLEALADGHIVRRGEPGAELEITVPLTSAEGVLGAITLTTESIRSAQELEEAERVLTVIAAQTAVAMERAWLVRRVEHKRRLEAIGEVAAGVAHELRNPLFGISSAAQLLRFRAREDPVVEKNVTRILREVERLNRMVTSLLDFGRPAAVHLAPGDPELLWDDLLELERERLAQHRLALRRVRPEHGVRCLIDAEQLKQVYLNILVNAVDAAPEGSELALVSTVLPNGGWRCRLTNGGPAIPPEVLPHVFEFFYSTKPGGTGIGLALCQRIMDEHGGSITIDSTPETGTSVTLSLPPTAAS